MAVGDPAAEAHAGSMFVLENVERPAVQPTPSTTSPRALVDWYARECASHLPAVPHIVVCAVAVGMGAARELFLTLVRGAATRLDEVVPVRAGPRCSFGPWCLYRMPLAERGRLPVRCHSGDESRCGPAFDGMFSSAGAVVKVAGAPRTPAANARGGRGGAPASRGGKGQRKNVTRKLRERVWQVFHLLVAGAYTRPLLSST